jgi:hypothetical protein
MIEVPHGYCGCGCGEKTKPRAMTDTKRGWRKGDPSVYVVGHSRRQQHVEDESLRPLGVPYGYCWCGCGQVAPIAKKTDMRSGAINGKPRRYLMKHFNMEVRQEIEFNPESTTQLISLTRGEVAIVDTLQYGKVAHHLWYAAASEKSHTIYAARSRSISDGPGTGTIFMHTVLLEPREGFISDHISGNGLDNRMINLREATRQENSQNARLPKNNRTGILGVFWNEGKNLYTASINVNCKTIYLGSFKKIEDAAEVRRVAEIKYHGQFRRSYAEEAL